MRRVAAAGPATAAGVRCALRARTEIVVLDVRTEAAFAQAHPLFAASLPLKRLSLQAPQLIPRLATPVVVYGSGAEDVGQALASLRALGYTDVRPLAGGLAGWEASGGELFADVNSPSKAFGELVADTLGTPMIAPETLRALLDAGEDVTVLDARRFDEYATMSIPTASSAPGATLVREVLGSGLGADGGLVVVNCAGRTRSIIGAQSLLNAGTGRRVVALRNGTIGWTLAGLTLDTGRDRRAGAPLTEAAVAAARALAGRAGVGHLDGSALTRLLADPGRTVYRFDVRSPEAFAAAHLPGFRSASGGQLVQETDRYAPVRGAAIVLADDGGTEAEMTASWLAQMGWDVAVLTGVRAADGAATGADPEPPPLDPQTRYRRPYEGTDVPAEAMAAYLEWEYGLVAQLDRDGTHGFRVLAPDASLTAGGEKDA